MAFFQLVFLEADGGTSGAEIRNSANFDALSTMMAGSVVAFRRNRKADAKPSHPTVRTLEAAEIQQLIEKVRSDKPAFVLLEGVALLQAAIALRNAFRELPLICDFHNVESLLHYELDAVRLPRAVRFLAPLFFGGRRRAALAADRAMAELSDMIWTCSDEDAARVRALCPQAEVAAIPNPVPAWCAEAGAAPDPSHRRILFTGHLRYVPNKRAVRELCLRILPAVRARLPGVRLHVCGRNPGPRLRRLIEKKGHEFTASPVDLAPVYAQASVVALPLREGGGTRIKAIEALSVGCPVVATEKAVEGLGLTPGRHYLNAETTAEFAEALVRVLSDKALHHGLACEGRRFAEVAFDPGMRRQAVERALSVALRRGQ